MYMALATTGMYSRDAEHFSKDFQTFHCDTHLKHFFLTAFMTGPFLRSRENLQLQRKVLFLFLIIVISVSTVFVCEDENRYVMLTKQFVQSTTYCVLAMLIGY